MKKNESLIKVLIIFFISLYFARPSFAEAVYLKSGKKVEGKIVERTDKYIKLDEGIGVDIPYFLNDIERIEDNAPLTVNSKDKGILTAVADAKLEYAAYSFELPPNLVADIDNTVLSLNQKKGFWKGKYMYDQAWILIAPTKTNGENSEFIKTSKDFMTSGGCSLSSYDFAFSFAYPCEIYLEHCPQTEVGNRYGLIVFAKLPTHVIEFSLYAAGENEDCLTPFSEDFNKVITSFRWTLGSNDEKIASMLKSIQ